MAMDMDKLQAFLGKFVTDLGATVAAGNVVIGHRLGLYKALAGSPATADDLAARTGTSPRYVAEWLRGQAAGGYVEYDAAADRYAMTEEQAFALTNPDYHEGSIELARKHAGEAGVSDRVSFEAASAASFSGDGYDLAATFDCLHDMGDPLAAARHVRQALKPDGTWLIVEPAATDDVAGNLNPVGRAYYSFSTLLCVPNALSQPGGFALGAQAGAAAIRQVVTDAGFTRFRQAAATPFNLVYEVRP
jgi:SAM-dependent methyltransferase